MFVLCVVTHSVKYEDPQALGGLASALDVRQQNTGGVSTLHACSLMQLSPICGVRGVAGCAYYG